MLNTSPMHLLTSHTHATFHNTEPDATLSSIHGKISSTLSDRCAVNHCVVQALEQHMQLGSIVELNCNMETDSMHFSI